MILDTNAITGILAGDKDLEPRLAGKRRHHIPVVVIGEYRYGLLSSILRKNLETLFDRLVEESFVLSVDKGTAYHYAEIRTALRKKGRPLPENDVWIAALARQHRLPIVSRDVHFDQIDEVERLSW